MKAKWIALLARRIRNGAIGDSHGPCLSLGKGLSDRCIYSNFVCNCRGNDILRRYHFHSADCRSAGRNFARKKLTETRVQNRARARRESRGEGMPTIPRAENFSRDTHTLRSGRSDLLMRWIAPPCSVADAKKGYRRRRERKGDRDSSVCRPDASQE